MRTFQLSLVLLAVMVCTRLGGTPVLAATAVSQSFDESAGLVLSQTADGTSLALAGAAPFYTTPRSIVNERLVAVEGTRVLLATWEEQRDSGEWSPFFAISLNGQDFDTVRETSYDILLRYSQFDPAFGVPHVGPRFAAEASNSIYIVQFITQPLEEFRAAIRELGGTVYQYLGEHAHIVKMDAATRDAVAGLPYVRWVGPLHPGYRLEEFLLENAERAEAVYPSETYNIMVFESGLVQKNAVARRIEGLGGSIQLDDAGKYLIEATLTPAQLFEVIRWNEVLFVDRWSPYEADMNIARQIGGANFIEATPGQYDGAGVRGEVVDSGFNLNHLDFQSRPLIRHGSVGSGSHGASTSGICFGDGTGSASARGLLPAGQGIVATFSTGSTRRNLARELTDPNGPYRGVFQTSSVGSSRTRRYTNVSADTDAQIFDFDYIQCQSQSNAGTQDSRPQAWAKNIISVGGVSHFNTLSKNDDRWTTASIGPASDGRIKPDFTHFYDNIRTTTCCGTTSYTNLFGGTSGATPIVAGYFGLFFDMWSDGIFGNSVIPGGTVFENRAHFTTAKAMMVNSAAQYDWVSGPSANRNLTRVRQGWGMPDVQKMYELRDQFFIVDEANLLTNLQVARHTVTVNPGEPAIKVTLVYADPPGVPNSNRHRINDLSLKVISPSQTVYWGNNGLQSGLWSAPGGVSNVIDTVENVFVQNPEPGDWVIEIHADEINQDGHVETGEIDADYALVVSGVEPAPNFTPGDLNCDGAFNGADIDPFFLALGDPLAYLAMFPDCNIDNADMNCDGAVNGADIDRFFACLAGNNCPDCNANGIPDDCDGIGPLTIVTQPQSTFACAGDIVTLTVETSSSPLTVQWRKDGVPIAGATSTRLRFNPVQSADAGDYDVIVGDACVSLTSDIATLTVHTVPAIHTHPRSQTVCLGAPLFLSVGASGPALTYQWRKNGTDIPGATDATYIVAAASESDRGGYDVVVANGCGTVRSDLASVTILITIFTHPAGQTVCENDPVIFTVGAGGTSLTYQWRKDGVDISGATQNFFVINAAAMNDAGIYDVVVISLECTQTSDPAPLVVQQCP